MTSSPQLLFDDAPRLRKHFASAEEQFQAFHRDNPFVYTLIVRYARKAKRRGFQHYGIGALWEIIRWDLLASSKSEDYKLNNNFRSRYARMVMKYQPDLEGFFETRRLRS